MWPSAHRIWSRWGRCGGSAGRHIRRSAANACIRPGKRCSKDRSARSRRRFRPNRPTSPPPEHNPLSRSTCSLSFIHVPLLGELRGRVVAGCNADCVTSRIAALERGHVLYARYKALLDGVLDQLVAEGALPAGLDRRNVAVEPPRDPAHGDLATNAAMVLAKAAGTNPRALAALIAPKLEALPGVTASRDCRAGVHQPAARRGRVARRTGRDSGRRRGAMAGRTSARASGSMSNMSRPTRPGRCTWAIAAARWSAMRWRRCSKRRASS